MMQVKSKKINIVNNNLTNNCGTFTRGMQESKITKTNKQKADELEIHRCEYQLINRRQSVFTKFVIILHIEDQIQYI